MKQSSKRSSYQSSAWKQEVELTKQIPNWDNILLQRIHKRIGKFAVKYIKKVGRNIDEMQFQFEEPIESIKYIPVTNTYRVRFNIYQPITKEPGTYDLRFSDDTGAVLVLVKSPKQDGEYDNYVLARRKYQSAPQKKVLEIARGFEPGKEGADIGWYLFRRHFPGLEGCEFVKNIWHTFMGDEFFENDSDFINKMACHLIVVTLNTPKTKQELQEFLTTKALEKAYKPFNPKDWEVNPYKPLRSNRRKSNDWTPEGLSEKDLKEAPIVLTIDEAAEAINHHLDNDGEAKDWMFSDGHSRPCWLIFAIQYRDQFPGILPKARYLPE